MLEYDDNSKYSSTKHKAFIESSEKNNLDIKRCADIIYQLETDESLSLNDKDLLKSELGDKVDAIKSNSSDMVDSLVTEYQLYNATAPRSSQNLSGLQLLKEKVVDRDRSRRMTPEEQQHDDAFYYNSDDD